MLYCAAYRKMTVKKAERKEDALWIYLEQGVQKLVPVDARSIHVLYTGKEKFSEAEKPGVLSLPAYSEWTHSETDTAIWLKLRHLWVEIDKESNRYRYYDGKGNLLLQERQERSKELEEFPIYRMKEEGIAKEYVDTPDGRKEVVRDAAKVQVGTAFHTRMHLLWEDEALYGLGQHEEGYHSLRGQKVYLHQANRKIAIPMLVSTKGYGILLNTYAPAIFNDTKEGSYLYTEADPEMDFYFMCGEDEEGVCISKMDRVIREYRRITGKATLLPKWAFGYIQSQERYEDQKEILAIAGEYRKRGIGLDCIVLDWCSWKDGEWGQKTFDPNRFPNVDDMTKQLHDEHVHFMLSIWPNLTEGTPDYEEFKEKGLLLPGIHNYDPLSREGRETYWKQAWEGLFCHGVDAWWCDNSEPFTPEWNHLVRPESSKAYEEYCRTTECHLPATMTNAYGFFHAQGIYEGQRTCLESKRVVNLTRSGYIGQQRFGTILWSGDISASWETLKKQIAAGLHFCASGLPYWTVDIGAFFVKNGMQWFWDGQFDDGPADPAYCELFTRWYQWGAFLPIFRGHGTDFRRELWEFDHPKAPFYQALLRANQLRYELMPYVYSLAGKAWAEDASIMKPLAFGFPEDKETWDIMDQYLFGDAMMICPVTTPGIYRENEEGKLIWDHEGREVYLPKGCSWHDYWTGEKRDGGAWIHVDAPLDRIPIFVKAGSIIPKRRAALSTEEQTDEIQYVVYEGADGCFELYEDAGDGYGYEKGECTWTKLEWTQATHKLMQP